MIQFDLGRYAKKVDVLDEDEAAEAAQFDALPGCAISKVRTENDEGFCEIAPENVPFEQENEQLNLPF